MSRNAKPAPTPVAIAHRGRMHPLESLIHCVLCVVTVGCWYPVYRIRLRHIRHQWRV